MVPWRVGFYERPIKREKGSDNKCQRAKKKKKNEQEKKRDE